MRSGDGGLSSYSVPGGAGSQQASSSVSNGRSHTFSPADTMMEVIQPQRQEEQQQQEMHSEALLMQVWKLGINRHTTVELQHTHGAPAKPLVSPKSASP